MFGFIKSTEKIDTTFQDYVKDKTLSIENNGETFGTSIFGDSLVIDETFSDILRDYDLDGDKILDKEEILAFQKALVTAAGEDRILDQKELNRLFTKSEKTTELSEKNTALFKALIITLKNGLHNFKTYSGYDNERSFSSVKEDGSGVSVQFFKTDKGDGYSVKIMSEGGKRKELVVCTNFDEREGADTFYDREENITTHIIYNDNGKVIEQSCLYRGDKRTNPYSEFNAFKYDENGNLIKRYDAYNNLKTGNNSSTTTKYNENGIMTEKSIYSVTNGYNTQEIIKYEEDGKTLKARLIRQEKEDIVIVQEYSGQNLENRIGLPTKETVYDKATGKLKYAEINKFDENGILIEKIVEDKLKGTTHEYDYSSINGTIESSFQGNIGNCFFLETINSLNTSNAGQKILNNMITKHVTADDNGQKHTIYKVKFGGASKIIEDLSSGIRNFPKEKIFIQEEYTVTEEELQEAALKAGNEYSSGDKDVLLQEIAYAKYRSDVAKTLQANNVSYSFLDKSDQLIAGLDIARGWNVDPEDTGAGGVIGIPMYLYTGKKSDVYFSKSDSQPVCKIDSNGNLSVLENSKSIWQPNLIKDESNVFDKRYDDINEVIKILKNDTKKDGTFNNYLAEVSLAITNQVINGQNIKDGSHAFTIKGIKDNKVILINPWNSTKEVTISIEDFMKSAKMINILKLSEKNS